MLEQTLKKSKDVLAREIEKASGVEVKPEYIEVKNQILYIKATPHLKTALLIKKEKILVALRAVAHIEDIR